MKNHLKILIVVGLLVMALPLFGYVAISGALTGNAVLDHQNSKDINNATCRSCHGKVTDAAAGTNGNNLNAHKRHFMSVFLNFGSNFVASNPAGDTSMGCAKCHQDTVYGDDEAVVTKTFEANDGAIRSIAWGNLGGLEGDLSYNEAPAVSNPNASTDGSDPSARKKVNVQMCRRCHGGLRTTASHVAGPDFTVVSLSGSTDTAVPLNPRGCLTGTCHSDGLTGKTAIMAHGTGPAVANGVVGPGSSTVPGGQGTWWIDQRYANSAANCYRCHGEMRWYDTNETNPNP